MAVRLFPTGGSDGGQGWGHDSKLTQVVGRTCLLGATGLRRASLAAQTAESAHFVGDLGSIPGWGRPSGEGNGNPPQHSCLENPRDRGAWWAAVHGVAESWT